jgi:hypothetical protein
MVDKRQLNEVLSRKVTLRALTFQYGGSEPLIQMDVQRTMAFYEVRPRKHNRPVDLICRGASRSAVVPRAERDHECNRVREVSLTLS